MYQEVIMAGTGGQGIMVMGQLLAHAALVENRNVVWFPSYGPETRGGFADCTVILSSDEIGSPVCDTPDTLIALNQANLDKYVSSVRPGGVIVINSSLAQVPEQRRDCSIFTIQGTDFAGELGNLRILNMVMLGAFISAAESVQMDSVVHALTQVIPAHRHSMIPLNETALRKGAEAVSRA